jgi:hypothetical protein
MTFLLCSADTLFVRSTLALSFGHAGAPVFAPA